MLHPPLPDNDTPEEFSAAGLIGQDVRFTKLLDRIPMAAGVPSRALSYGLNGLLMHDVRVR
jgi:hypothetical protein